MGSWFNGKMGWAPPTGPYPVVVLAYIYDGDAGVQIQMTTPDVGFTLGGSFSVGDGSFVVGIKETATTKAYVQEGRSIPKDGRTATNFPSGGDVTVPALSDGSTGDELFVWVIVSNNPELAAPGPTIGEWTEVGVFGLSNPEDGLIAKVWGFRRIRPAGMGATTFTGFHSSNYARMLLMDLGKVPPIDTLLTVMYVPDGPPVDVEFDLMNGAAGTIHLPDDPGVGVRHLVFAGHLP